MMNISCDFINILTLTISIAAIAGVVYVAIGWYNNRKADLFLTILSYNGEIIGAVIKNKGLAVATNIKLVFPKNTNLNIGIFSEGLKRIVINPGEQFNILFSCPYECDLQYRIEWKDKRTKLNSKLRNAQLLKI